MVLWIAPPHIVTENPEIGPQKAAETRAWVESQLASLGLSFANPLPKSNTSSHKILGFPYADTIVIAPWHVMPMGLNQTSNGFNVMHIIRGKDCLFMGAIKQSEKSFSPLPLGEVFTAQQILSRTFKQTNTVYLSVQSSDKFAARAKIINETEIGEKLAQQGVPINANAGRFACQTVSEPNQVAPVYPSRSHRVLQYDLTFKHQGAWPLAKGTLHWASGVFGERKDLVTNVKDFISWSPYSYTTPEQLAAVSNALHVLNEAKFKVTRRQGKHVYIDHGRAFGLQIGLHLIGPNQSKLHLIRYAPEDKNPDAAIAMVRYESPTNPIAIGDFLNFDPQVYPSAIGE